MNRLLACILLLLSVNCSAATVMIGRATLTDTGFVNHSGSTWTPATNYYVVFGPTVFVDPETGEGDMADREVAHSLPNNGILFDEYVSEFGSTKYVLDSGERFSNAAALLSDGKSDSLNFLADWTPGFSTTYSEGATDRHWFGDLSGKAITAIELAVDMIENWTINPFHSPNEPAYFSRAVATISVYGESTGAQVPEMDAGSAALGIGLVIALAALVRDRRRA